MSLPYNNNVVIKFYVRNKYLPSQFPHFLVFRSTPFRLGSESPDLVSMDLKDGNGRREIKEDSGMKDPGRGISTNRADSNSCLSDTTLGIINFKSSVELTTPSFFKDGVENWSRNAYTSDTPNEIRHNLMKPTSSSPMHRQRQNPISEQLHQSSTDLISPAFHSQHNEFIQCDLLDLSNDPAAHNSSTQGMRSSRNCSNSNPHLYL